MPVAESETKQKEEEDEVQRPVAVRASWLYMLLIIATIQRKVIYRQIWERKKEKSFLLFAETEPKMNEEV